MARILLIALILSFGLASLHAQSVHEYCAFELAEQKLRKVDPQRWEQSQALFHAASERANTAASPRDEDQIYRIPVIVHVVWSQPEHNISDQRIRNQIKILNDDFRSRNAETPRDEFTSVVGDARIEFNLIDIVRVETEAVFDWMAEEDTIILPDHVKFSHLGGSDAVSVQEYFNIWVCDLVGGLRGWAYPPSRMDNWPDIYNVVKPELEGAVVDYKYFGKYTDEDFVSDGRIMVHEAGHYLGLRHIWGDGDCDTDDGIEDTPLSKSPNFDCDYSSNSCTENQNQDLPDMIENHMDYSDCKHTFTKGQIKLMRFVLENRRFNLRTPIPTDETKINSASQPNPGLGQCLY